MGRVFFFFPFLSFIESTDSASPASLSRFFDFFFVVSISSLFFFTSLSLCVDHHFRAGVIVFLPCLIYSLVSIVVCPAGSSIVNLFDFFSYCVTVESLSLSFASDVVVVVVASYLPIKFGRQPTAFVTTFCVLHILYLSIHIDTLHL